MANIVETFTLPSKGLVYDGVSVNPEIVLGSMKTKHEMLRLSANGTYNKIMADILDDCIESDMGISAYDLCNGDFLYLLYMLRLVTFGNEYEISGACPFCGFENYYKVNLDELPLFEFDPIEMENLKTLTLSSGEEVKLKLQTARMVDNVEKQAQEYRRRHKDGADNPVFLYTIVSAIDTIDGEKVNEFALAEWVKELPMKDTNAIVNRIDKMNGSIGVDTTMIDKCNLCRTSFEIPFRINSTFFRPGTE